MQKHPFEDHRAERIRALQQRADVRLTALEVSHGDGQPRRVGPLVLGEKLAELARLHEREAATHERAAQIQRQTAEIQARHGAQRGERER